MWEIMSVGESGCAAIALWASWWIVVGSKTYHLDYKINEVSAWSCPAYSCMRAGRLALIVSSQLHPAIKTANKAKRATHFMIGLLSFVALICIGVDAREGTVAFFVGISWSWSLVRMLHRPLLAIL